MQTGEFVAAFREAFGRCRSCPCCFAIRTNRCAPPQRRAGVFSRRWPRRVTGGPWGSTPRISVAGAASSIRVSAPCRNSSRSSSRSRSVISRRPKWCWTSSLRSTCGPGPKAWLEFVRVDAAGTFDGAEGVLFFATPDVLAGLVTWAGFDNDAPDAVAAPFGSGCSTVVSQAVRENRNGGHRCFLGLFHPSVRPWVGADELCFVIPMSRFAGMCGTMRASCLFGTHAWDKVRERINKMNL